METQKKLNKKSYYLISLIIIVLIATGIYLYLENRGKFEYKGRLDTFKFNTYQIGNVEIYRPEVVLKDATGHTYKFIYAFRNQPIDLDNVFMEKDIGKKLQGEKVIGIYISRAPEFSQSINGSFSLAVAPMETILGRSDAGIYKKDLRNTYTSHSKEEPKVDTINCDTINLSVNFDTYFRVIELRLGNENKVYSEGKCIIIEGKDEKGVIASAEKFAYELIGVF